MSKIIIRKSMHYTFNPETRVLYNKITNQYLDMNYWTNVRLPTEKEFNYCYHKTSSEEYINKLRPRVFVYCNEDRSLPDVTRYENEKAVDYIEEIKKLVGIS